MIKFKNFCKFLLPVIVYLGFCAAACTKELPPAKPKKYGKEIKFTFEKDTSGKQPPSFLFDKTGEGNNGTWLINEEKTASGSNVLVQTETDPTSYRFPLAIADAPVLKNLALSVSCKAISGKVDQACGIVFRYQDKDNYYIIRANALEDNVRLYSVINGDRKEITGWNGKVTPLEWHQLKVEALDNRYEIYWDNNKIIDAIDDTFLKPGKSGVWTKADSVTAFDDLTVTELSEAK